jgi:hypothetical protein
MTGCLLYLIEIYLCCEVGHKIKKQASAIGKKQFSRPILLIAISQV